METLEVVGRLGVGWYRISRHFRNQVLDHRVDSNLELLTKDVQSVRTPGSKIDDSRAYASRMQNEPHGINRWAQEFRGTPFVKLWESGI